MKMPGHKGVAEKRLPHRQRPYVRTLVELEADERRAIRNLGRSFAKQLTSILDEAARRQDMAGHSEQ